MIRFALAATALLLGFSAVMAQSDPIAERKATMKMIGGATGLGAKIAKGEEAFDAAKVQGIFKTYVDSGKKMETLFPDSSKTGDTAAGPKIWEDQANFKAAQVKFESDAAAAATATTDLASFRTAFGTVTKNCAACHETYRIKK
jgi:cytochrome c556